MGNKKLTQWIYDHLGEDWGGNGSPPGSTQKLEFGELDGDLPMHVAVTYCNDGQDIWLAYNQGGKWLAHYEARHARRLAWFILWDWWAVATWFGLKRKIWYWALHEIVVSQDAACKRAREAFNANQG